VWSERSAEGDPPVWHGLHAVDGGFRLEIRCQGRGSFTFRDDDLVIAWEPEGTGPAHYLFGLGLSFWLEQRGTLCLHAAAISRGGRAFGLIGDSLAGKTTLTTALLQHGFSLLSDDLLTLAERDGAFSVEPGLPQLRMWPDTIVGLFPAAQLENATRVHANFDKRLLPVAHIGSRKAARTAAPLHRLYMLERDQSGTRRHIALERISPSEAVLALIRASVIGDAARALGIERSRLAALARVVDTVRVSRLRYPNGLGWLPQVCRAIALDLASR
jgi:hypothetical protein